MENRTKAGTNERTLKTYRNSLVWLVHEAERTRLHGIRKHFKVDFHFILVL